MSTNSQNRPVAFVLVSSDHGTMLVNRNDFHNVGGQAYGVGYQLLQKSAFDREEVSLVLGLLSLRRNFFGDGVVALDCGANIGVHAVEWARHLYGWGSVLAFEAQERVFYALAGNLTLNNCFNARAIWAAVGASEGQIGVPQPDYLKPSSFGSLELIQSPSNEQIGQAIDYKNLQPTRLLTLDGLGLNRVDFIKIDVEGMEVDVLAGAEALVAHYHPQILVEHIKSDRMLLAQMLQDRGYRLFASGINTLCIHADDPTKDHVVTQQ